MSIWKPPLALVDPSVDALIFHCQTWENEVVWHLHISLKDDFLKKNNTTIIHSYFINIEIFIVILITLQYLYILLTLKYLIVISFNATPLQTSPCLGKRQEYLIRSLIFCILLAIYTYNNSQNTLRNRKILQILPINSCAFINIIILIFTISIEYTITGFWYTDGQAILISV